VKNFNIALTFHEKYMNRCLNLASKGLGNVAPNPLVGSVIVHQNKIIGEGYHHQYGGAHAEVIAINSVRQTELLKESTIYVSLEPCAHFGKTPPCTDLIIKKDIPTIVVGCIDPYGEVAGKGIEKLRAAGREVIVGILEPSCSDLNRRFFTFHQQKRPYVILKWAQTADGFIDKLRESIAPQINWITTAQTQQQTHHWRSQEAAILVGKNTIINDNPSLTCRAVCGRNPLRIVIDRKTTLPINQFAVFNSDAETLVFNEVKNEKVQQVTYCKIDFSHFIEEVMSSLYQRNIQSVIIEGGSTTLQSFIDKNIWDEARILEGNQTFGKGIKAPILQGIQTESSTFGADKISYYRNV
jgi:diaminohydroxyphosphoribosylaminopyrimidine deaminase / 5-amino-6-(5-phosphoribosylamino)uracil reductase